MIPGMNSNMMSKDQEKFAIARIKKFLCMLDSMNDAELDSTKTLSESWMKRIAIGSGASMEELNQLLEEHKWFSTMISKMADKKIGDPGSMKEMQRNPAAMMKKLQSSVDPRMLA